jgi:hypothetical protein
MWAKALAGMRSGRKHSCAAGLRHTAANAPMQLLPVPVPVPVRLVWGWSGSDTSEALSSPSFMSSAPSIWIHARAGDRTTHG